MSQYSLHNFHIPVMGLSFTVDTPVKVARFGISSVVSITEHNMLESMRSFYCHETNRPYVAITSKDDDYRSKRITEYLNLLNEIVSGQIRDLCNESFENENDINKYFLLLPEYLDVKQLYKQMLSTDDVAKKNKLQNRLRNYIVAGAIDVNIMTKVDRPAYDTNGQALPPEFSDAMTALRGFANSSLNSSVVFSAGFNSKLYSYCEQFRDFFPDINGVVKKKIIIKVSDFRSAQIQGRFFAKKGIWISEFRIESGLNCGGHAFATNGLLLGPILEEFKQNRQILYDELFSMCQAALAQKERTCFTENPDMRITVQGGIGTASENAFLLQYYEMDGTGWGSPFLLVPEATNVDEETLHLLATASKDDYYLSDSSPLGVPFNNFRKTSAEKQRKERIEKERPGSPCYKKFLAFNNEFSGEPLCTASRKYQHLKLNQLNQDDTKATDEQLNDVIVKDCLCEGLSASVFLVNRIPVPHNLKAVTICPGPNLAYFSGVFSLSQMVDHIYGRGNVLNSLVRPHMFINELQLYIDYLDREIKKTFGELNEKKEKQLIAFKENLFKGINYYRQITTKLKMETSQFVENFKNDLLECEMNLKIILLPEPTAK
ncbi:MAG: hypothetical protein JNJ94_10220 [Chlorobi bacterium]|nr:hypothetical protein [Chlorobiota bacterium]